MPSNIEKTVRQMIVMPYGPMPSGCFGFMGLMTCPQSAGSKSGFIG